MIFFKFHPVLFRFKIHFEIEKSVCYKISQKLTIFRQMVRTYPLKFAVLSQVLNHRRIYENAL